MAKPAVCDFSAPAVAKAWAAQYPDDIQLQSGVKAGDIRLQLESLPVGSPKESIDTIVGNNSWTGECCDGCGQYHNWIVVVGDPPDYESSTAFLCRSCLTEAAALAGLK